MADNRRDWRGPDLSIISLEVNDPVKQDGVWDVVVVAVVAYRKREVPRDPKRVVFDSEGATVSVETTDSEGRVSYVFSFDSPGGWMIGAQIEGMPGSRRSHRVSIKEEKPKVKVVKDVALERIGKPGDYEVCVRVVAEGEGVIGSRRLSIQEMRGLEAEKVEDTDENGCFKFSAKFRELERTYIVTDIGSGQTKRVRLFGSPI